ncbi:Oidioi.mRNA.OKI2018_I69.chr2.g5307.t1.cds [Oikopleura dioica]|uniref:Oidioi.mRNA.OKI2018_I69.chr2.g5307.t1.cds n=1 Tax=Oikopleura dioica TaxID=34765 RepID=A0ABN7SZW9_OIKDI|nr:Oidioi.mRNA.OKI2018_I69.chr2.g5307.t1.cds [Oikopleura dioica]
MKFVLLIFTLLEKLSECRQEYTPYGRLIESNKLFHHKKVSASRSIHKARGDNKKKSRYYRPPRQRKNENQEGGRRGPRGMPGPPGPPGTCPENVCRAAVEPQFSNLLKEIATQLENENLQSTPARIAFTVGLSDKNFTRVNSKPTTVVYDRVILNQSTGEAGFGRGGYSPISGAFVAPVEGIYHFTVTALQNEKRKQVFVVLTKQPEDVALCSITSQGNYQSSSCSAFVRLKVGEFVQVELLRGVLLGHPYLFNTFSGSYYGD